MRFELMHDYYTMTD